jgi:hypothetical protein
MLEGAFLPLPDIVSTALVVGIGGVDNDFTAPFDVNASTPVDVEIYILSDATIDPNFLPVQDINPASIVVNGVAFPGAVILPAPTDLNNDGLEDAIVVISPRSALRLTTATNQLVVEGLTLPTSPFGTRRFIGTAPIIVTGGGGGGGGLPGLRTRLVDLFNPNAAVPRFGERLMPSPAIAGRLNWRPGAGRNLLFRQFLPGPGYRGRINEFFHGTGFYPEPLGSKLDDSHYGISALGQDVFTRGRFSREGLFDARTFIPRKGTWLYGDPGGGAAGHGGGRLGGRAGFPAERPGGLFGHR